MTAIHSGESASQRRTHWWWGAAALVFGGLILVPLSRIWQIAPDLGHGWAAPILMAYLWWERWNNRPTASPTSTWFSAPRFFWSLTVILVLTAVPLRLLLTPFPVWPMIIALYVSTLIAIGLLLVNREFGPEMVRWVAGPLIVLCGVIPWPGVFERAVILPLRHGIATLVAEISNLLGQPAIASGTSLRLAENWVGIDEACGGIRSLQACVTTALFFGEWLKLSFRQRILLVVVGVTAAVSGNLGRVGFLTWCAAGPEGTLERWHDTAGWIALGFSLLLTGVIGWLWGRSNLSPSNAPRRPRTSQSEVPRSGTLIAILVLALGSIEGGVRWWYGHANETDQESVANPWTVSIPANALAFERVELSESAVEMLLPDAYLTCSWVGNDGNQRMMNYFEWHEGQTARSAPFLHNPTVCMPHAGAELLEELGPIDIPWAGGTVPFQSFLFQSGTDVIAVAFTIWDPSTGAPMRLPPSEGGLSSWLKIRWADVVARREHQPAQMLAFGINGLENQNLLADEIKNLMIPAGKIDLN